MKRIAVLAALTLTILLPGTSVAAATAEFQTGEGRIVVLRLDGTSLDDWLRADTFHLRRAVREGTPGLLSARTAAPAPASEAACLARSDAALATLVNGSRSDGNDLEEASPLHVALQRGGVSMRTIAAPLIRDSSFPTGRRTDQTRLAQQFRAAGERVVLLDVPDTLFADCAGGRQRDRWVGVALGRADATVGVVRSSLAEGDRLIVIGGVGPQHREATRNYLSAATIEDPTHDDASILTSPTTRRRGVVSLTDVAGTVAALAGLDVTIGVGRAWTGIDGTLDDLRRADDDFAHQSAIRLPIMRGFVWLSVVLLTLAGVVVLAGRGRARAGRVPRSGRDWIAFGLATLTAAPAAMLIEPFAGSRSLALSVAVIVAGAAVIAAIASAARGLAGAPAVCAGIAAWGLIAFVGEGELGARSVLSYSVAGGDRFFGVGNEMMGVAIAGTLLALAQWLDGWPAAVKWAPAIALIVTGAMAAPVTGAKFGSILVSVPAFGFFVVRAFGKRPGRETALGLAIATVLLAGIFAAWDLMSDPQAQSHVARAIADGDTIGRKIGAAVRLAAGSYWTAGVLVPAIIAATFLRRRPTLVARGTWAHPNLRAALSASAIAAATAIAFNDAGILAAALISILATAAFLSALLIGQAARVDA